MMKCDACGWDSAKREAIRQEPAFREAMVHQVPVIVVLGPRPAHTCGKPDTRTVVELGLDALYAFQKDPSTLDATLRQLRRTVAELEMLCTYP
jgi:hypothetical protein